MSKYSIMSKTTNELHTTKFVKDKLKDAYNLSMAPYRTAKIAYASPIAAFFAFFDDKYRGGIFSIVIILLFTAIYRSVIRDKTGSTNVNSVFIAGIVQTWFVLLILIILMQML